MIKKLEINIILIANHLQWQYYKMSLYEGSVRVPLIISGGDFSKKPKLQSDSPASLLDIYPTLLDAAGLKSKTPLDGISLVNYKDITLDRPIISQYHAEHMNSSAFMIVVSNAHSSGVWIRPRYSDLFRLINHNSRKTKRNWFITRMLKINCSI